MMRGFAIFLLSVLPLGYAIQNGQGCQHGKLNLLLVKPKPQVHESCKSVHSWSSDFPSSLTNIHIASSVSSAPGIIIIKAADPGVNSVEAVVNYYAKKEADFHRHLFNVEVGNDLEEADSTGGDDGDEGAKDDNEPTTKVTLEGPDGSPRDSLWVEVVLRLPRDRHYNKIETSSYSDTISWTHKVEDLKQFGITVKSLGVDSSNGSIYINKIVAKNLNVAGQHGVIKIASSALTGLEHLNVFAPNGGMQIQ